ncbi:YktB family protein [Jeotgalibacillus proteolyticus]|uniref:YktB family protein n=1 Tax=Jeotgalibacillus proteolyticus TaxID=2082395 RepID=UPI003CEA9086
MPAVFEKQDFDVFKLDGLETRMSEIQSRIQPKFEMLGEELVPFLSELVNEEMHLHIARHARRTINPPNDTWMAISSSKRGYKKLPHFQVGLWDDHLFVWLAFIYELPNKSNIADSFLTEFDDVIKTFPEDGWISSDHMKKEAKQISEMNDGDFMRVLERFKNVKKAEFLVGKRFLPTDHVIQNKEELLKEIKQIYAKLLPLYKHGMKVQSS